MAGVATHVVRVRFSRTATLLVTVAVVLVSTVACGGGGSASADCANAVPKPVASPATASGPPAVPTTGAYLGAFAFNGSDFTEDRRIASLNALETAICRPLDIVHIYVPWQSEFPTLSQLAAARAGQTLLMSWTGTDMRRMASGADDAEIRTVAHEVAALRSPVFVEFRWEMERLNLASVVHSPADFIAAWDHTRAIFNEVGVKNASWVWCPTSTGFDQGDAQAYYPGASEVDWICADVYPWPPGAYEDLQDELAAFMTWAVPQGKPIMLGEVGVPQSYSVDLRNRWIDNASAYLRATPAIKAFVYFDWNPIDHPIERDWLLAPGSEALAHFRTLANNPWFRPKVAPQSASG